jgi:hypothetical protein
MINCFCNLRRGLRKPVTVNRVALFSYIIAKIDMKIVICIVIILAIATSAGLAFSNPFSKFDCTYEGKKLYGTVKFVEDLADIRVRVVTSLPDLRVQPVVNFPNKCGQWQLVEGSPHLKVQVVDSLANLKIRFVEELPGIP